MLCTGWVVFELVDRASMEHERRGRIASSGSSIDFFQMWKARAKRKRRHGQLEHHMFQRSAGLGRVLNFQFCWKMFAPIMLPLLLLLFVVALEVGVRPRGQLDFGI